MSRVIVVGGGAAGMMAAYAAAACGHGVTLLEQNEKLGKKLYITGKGRCNVTNACDAEGFFANVVSNPKFLYSAYHAFDNRRMMELLESAGCRLKVERGERVFPVSDHASDVTAALRRLLERERVHVRLGARVQSVLTVELPEEAQTGQEGDGPKRRGAGQRVRAVGVRLADGSEESADAVILATGGLSYPTTGSSGDGHRMARALGHSVKECVPALVPMEIAEEWCASLQGLSLKNVSLTLFDGKKKVYEGFGEMLFTHFGISGPLVLSAASHYGRCREKERIVCEINLKPALTEEQLDRRILRDFEENINRNFQNALGGLYPAKLIPVMVALAGVEPDRKVHDVTREERRRLAALTRHLRMTVTGIRDFSEAIVTQGGVSVKEVNPSTMESRIVKGLYFAGELLDLDALTGGFNLQIAWSTGHLAGEGIGSGPPA